MVKYLSCLALLASFIGGAFASEGSIATCEVKLDEYEENAPYSEELDGDHLDFRAPYAVFSVASPSKFEGRRIRVIFLSSKHDGVLAELESGVGGSFTLALPNDYFNHPDGTMIKGYLIDRISRAD